MEDLIEEPAPPMDAILAAMMEELGVSRKDTLPLENKKGCNERVDVNALKSGIRANPLASHWKTATFDDVNPGDLELDSIGNGQSHRARMLAGLGTSVRGSYAQQASRGGGRGGYMVSGGGRGLHRSSASGEALQGSQGLFHSLESVFSHIDRATATTRSTVKGGTSGTRSRSQSIIAKQPVLVPLPRPNLSFNDRRSVNELPIFDNISAKTFSNNANRGSAMRARNLRPKGPQNFALASPEVFIEHIQNRILKSEYDPEKEYHQSQKDVPAVNLTSAVVHNSQSPVKPTAAHLQSDASLNTVPLKNSAFANPEPSMMRFPPTILVPPKIDNGERNVIRDYECVIVGKHNKEPKQQNFRGRARIIELTGDREATVLLEVESNTGLNICRMPLQSGFEHTTSSSTLVFRTADSGETNEWILSFDIPWKCKSFSETLKNWIPQVTFMPTAKNINNRNSQGRSNNTDYQETLICFSNDEVEPTQQFVESQQESLSHYTQELLALVTDTAVDQTLLALASEGPVLDQISTMMAISTTSAGGDQNAAPDSPEILQPPTSFDAKSCQLSSDKVCIIDLKQFPAYKGGLMSSRWATAATAVTKVLVKNLMTSRSEVFNRLPAEMRDRYTEELGWKLLEKVSQDSSTMSSAISTSSPSSQLAEQGFRGVRYTAEDMKKWRSQASIIKGNLILKEWIAPHAAGTRDSCLPFDGVKQKSTQSRRHEHGNSKTVENFATISWDSLVKQPANTCVSSLMKESQDAALPRVKMRGLSSSKFADSIPKKPTNMTSGSAPMSSSIISPGFAEISVGPPITNDLTDSEPTRMKLRASVLMSEVKAEDPENFRTTIINTVQKKNLGIGGLSSSRFARPSDFGIACAENRVSSGPKITSEPTTPETLPTSLSNPSITTNGNYGASNLPPLFPHLVGNKTAKLLSDRVHALPAAASSKVSELQEISMNGILAPSMTNSNMMPEVFQSAPSISSISQVATFLTRRNSFNSQRSENSIATVNPDRRLLSSIHDAAVPDRSPQLASNHCYRSSNESSASFETAAEGIDSGEANISKPTPGDLGLVDAIGADLACIYIHNTDVSGMESSDQAVASTGTHISQIDQHGSSKLFGVRGCGVGGPDTPIFKPFKPQTTITQSTMGKCKGGLSASRWADKSVHDVYLDVALETAKEPLKPAPRILGPQSHSVNVRTSPSHRSPSQPMFGIDSGQSNFRSGMLPSRSYAGSPAPTMGFQPAIRSQPLPPVGPVYQTVIYQTILVPAGSGPVIPQCFPNPQPMLHSHLVDLHSLESPRAFGTATSPSLISSFPSSTPQSPISPPDYFSGFHDSSSAPKINENIGSSPLLSSLAYQGSKQQEVQQRLRESMARQRRGSSARDGLC